MLCPRCGAANQEDVKACASCGLSAAEDGGLARGTIVASRYEILSVLGRGGMGVVYEAHDRSLDETVALKLVREDTRIPELAARLRSEIKLARRVRHHNVCSIFGDGEHEGRLFVSLELIDGVDLKRQLKEHGALKASEAFEVAIQAAEGLGAIHAAGIVHRDLKTANLMRDGRGRLVVMDFGLAKSSGEASAGGLTQTGYVVGTPDYMSPEQARDQPLSPASDVYALGIIVYELFTGERPFAGDTPVSTLLRRLTEPPPLDRAVGRGLPESLVPVLGKAMAIPPDQRYPDGTAFAHALRSARDLHATRQAVDSAADTQAAVSLPTRRPIRSALAVALLTGALALVIYVWPRPPALIVAPEPSTPSPSPAGSVPLVALNGDRVDCLLAGRFSSLHLQMPDGLKGGRLYFRSNLSPEYFYTEVVHRGPSWLGFIPKVNPGGGIREITYYFTAARGGSTETLKTEPKIAFVVDQASACPSAGRIAEEGDPRGVLSVLSVLAVAVGNDLALPIADAFGFQTLLGGLKDPDPEVRLATAQSVTEMVDLIVHAIRVVVARLGSRNAGDRQQAGNDLAVTGRKAVRGTVEALIPTLRDKNPEIRRSVATTLGLLGQALAEARSALSDSLRDADKDVRVSATQALAAMGSAVTAIGAALRTAEDNEEDDATTQALAHARQRIEEKLTARGTPRK